MKSQMVPLYLTMLNLNIQKNTKFLKEKINIKNPKNPVYEVADGSIVFDNVNFKYSEKAERMALSNINLKIKSGETIGIIGGTGSSKSSLIQLIPRLYDATE